MQHTYLSVCALIVIYNHRLASMVLQLPCFSPAAAEETRPKVLLCLSDRTAAALPSRSKCAALRFRSKSAAERLPISSCSAFPSAAVVVWLRPDPTRTAWKSYGEFLRLLSHAVLRGGDWDVRAGKRDVVERRAKKSQTEPRRSQEGPGGARRSQEEPGGPRRSQE